MQALKPAPSSWHSKLATPDPPGSEPLKVKLAELLLGSVGVGGVIVVSGGVASTRTVTVNVALANREHSVRGGHRDVYMPAAVGVPKAPRR